MYVKIISISGCKSLLSYIFNGNGSDLFQTLAERLLTVMLKTSNVIAYLNHLNQLEKETEKCNLPKNLVSSSWIRHVVYSHTLKSQ